MKFGVFGCFCLIAREAISLFGGRPLQIAIIVPTYNDPGALTACLRGLAAQTRRPDAVYIADDGSGPATREVVASFASHLPVRHIWQEDTGYRVSMIRNRAVAAACEDYLLFLDGDTVPHPRFVADHLLYARPGRAVLGGRCCVTEVTDPNVFRSPTFVSLALLFLRGRVINDSRAFAVNFRNRVRGALKGTRLFWPIYRRATEGETHGGNMAVWREDVLAVNGFDERFVDWGGEDRDLVYRLSCIGIEPWQLLFRAICFHIDHPLYARNPNRDRLLREERPTACVYGVSQYLDDADAVVTSNDLSAATSLI